MDSTKQNSECGIGSWINKHRYEDNDICLSPPDESEFMSLKFGVHHTRPQPSMFDRINQELGFTTKNLHDAKTNYSGYDNQSATLKYGSGGLFLEAKSSSSASDLTGSLIKIKSQEGSYSPNIIMPAAVLGYSGTENESENTTENEETLICKTHQNSRRRKMYKDIVDTAEGRQFLDNIQNLSVKYPEHDKEEEKNTSHIVSNSLNTSREFVTSSEFLNTSSADVRKRRRSSVPSDLNKLLIEHSVQNAFFTGGLFSSSSSTKISAIGQFHGNTLTESASSPAAALSVPNIGQLAAQSPKTESQNFNLIKKAFLINHPTKLKDHSQETGTLETKNLKKRPKASQLREMNIWSPQSM